MLKPTKILVSSKDANRARTDITFATQLLQHAKQSTQQSTLQIDCTSPYAGTSSQQEPVANLDTTIESAEDAHAWKKQKTLLLLELYRENQIKFLGGKGTVKSLG